MLWFVYFSILLSMTNVFCDENCIGCHNRCARYSSESDCSAQTNNRQNSKRCRVAASHRLTKKVYHINTSSACARCDMCIAIAKQINETLVDVHEHVLTNLQMSDHNLSTVVRGICDESFKNYGLWEIDGKRYILNRSSNSIPISTSVDESWNKLLSEKCHEILEDIGIKKLYNFWVFWDTANYFEKNVPNLITILCNNEFGLFRDCKNII